ncbi:MAG: S-layer homology domain-containing protein [Armatimonadota bacterium]|nr:S-layer homology domain-containing protein [bacterium]
MKKMTFVLVALVLVCAAPVFAQGPFTDVPTDHWAYDAVNQLQEDGILIGYPDGTFGGKKTITRYEFAVALARLVDYIPGLIPPGSVGGVSQADLDKALAGYAKKSEIPTVPTLSNLATKADVDAIRKLVDEFRDELAALGVDVDALKRDVAALACRVDILEAEVKRVKVTGNANVFAITDMNNSFGNVPAVDLDNRLIPQDANLGNSVAVVRDLDLNIVGRVSDATTVNATINYGNYLNYVRYVDDFVGAGGTVARPTTKTDGQGGKDFVDGFFPYYAYISAATGKGNLSVGRFPLAFTPYTLKMIDVDSYTTILKTDDGYYPMDGVSLVNNFGGVDVMLFAAKNDENDYLINGLTGQPNNDMGTFNQVGGHAVGGLNAIITQTAGARATMGIPWSGKLGLTYYQGWSENATSVTTEGGLETGVFDQARVYGADVNVPIGMFDFNGSYTKSDTLAAGDAPAGVDDITDDGVAWDGAFGTTIGKLYASAGYKSIGSNFAAAGAWDKIGHWTNPVNVKGPYADFTYPILCNLNLVLNGELMTVIDPTSWTGNTKLTTDDQILKAEGGLQWGISKSNSLALGYQYVKFTPDNDALDNGVESYLTIGWAHQVNPDAALKIGYQFINWDGGDNSVVYGPDYRAGVGVVQFGVSF